MAIKYLKNNEIDKSKWDSCIAHSPNGLIYSTSIFLDSMATDWDALILDDYQAVMPLPFRKKYGIYYVYPPPFSQQIGITGLTEITSDIVESFLKQVPKKFRYVEMNFNVENKISCSNAITRNNYFLPLTDTFEKLQKGFSRSAVRNIKKAVEENILTKEGVATEEIIAIHRERFSDKVGANEKDYKRLQRLFISLTQKNMLFSIGAFKANKLIAGSIYFIYKKRITFIINGNNEESLRNGATHLLVNDTIKRFSEKGFTLDFEGSDFPEFVRFYTQYGAIKENYCLLKINNLPWPFSLLKK